MSGNTFRAWLAEGNENAYAGALKELPRNALPDDQVLVENRYSSLNYKDALAVTGRGKVIRKFPMICGIDLAGIILESNSPEFQTGDEVFAVGQGLGETRWGGLSQLACVPADVLLHKPTGLSLQQSMAIGTAGFTAMLSVIALEQNGLTPGKGPVLVTGATGGVGSLAICLLAGLGYEVVASTGRPELGPYLFGLGAKSIIERAELEQKCPPLASERWAGAIDSVGGQTLSSVIAATASYGSIAVCGLAGGPSLVTTVFPFILRNVSLLGINSKPTSKPIRTQAWERLARELPPEKLEMITTVAPLSNIAQLSEQLLAGKIKGRTVIDVNQ